jgi:hypothetical protein
LITTSILLNADAIGSSVRLPVAAAEKSSPVGEESAIG